MVPCEGFRLIVEELRERINPTAIWVRYCEEEYRLDVYFDSDTKIQGEDIEEYIYRKDMSFRLHIRHIQECIDTLEGTIEQTLYYCRRINPGTNELHRQIQYRFESSRRSIELFREICSMRGEYLKACPHVPAGIFDDCASKRFSSMISQTAHLIQLVLNSHGEKIKFMWEAVSEKVFGKYYGGNREIWAEMMRIYNLIETEQSSIPFVELFQQWKKYADAVEDTYNHYATISPVCGKDDSQQTDPGTGSYIQGQNAWDTYTDLVMKEVEEYHSSVEEAKRELLKEAKAESEELYELYKKEYGDI